MGGNGVAVGVGAAPVGASETPRVDSGAGVDPAADEEAGTIEDVVAGEAPASAGDFAAGEEVVAGWASGPVEGAAADEEVVADETSGLSEYAAAGKEVVADETSAPAGDAMSGDASTGVDAAALTGAKAGSEDIGASAAELESGVPAGGEASPDGRTAAVPASGVEVSVAAAAAATGVVPVVSAAPVAASNPPAKVVAGVSTAFGAGTPYTDEGAVTTPPPPLAPLLDARVACEGCKLLSAAPLRLLLGWPSAVAVRAQCVASALWNGAPGGAPGGGTPAEAPGGAPEGGLDRFAPLEGEPEGSDVAGMSRAIGLFMPAPRRRSKQGESDGRFRRS